MARVYTSSVIGASAARVWAVKKLSRESIPVIARPVNPAPASHRNSRRVRRQKEPFGVVSREGCVIYTPS